MVCFVVGAYEPRELLLPSCLRVCVSACLRVCMLQVIQSLLMPATSFKDSECGDFQVSVWGVSECVGVSVQCVYSCLCMCGGGGCG